jgi:CheY-like chemotaxis protein
MNQQTDSKPKLKVLVFDDAELHRQSATLLLGQDYDLTVVGTYDEAQAALLEKTDLDKMENIFAEKFGDCHPYKAGIDDVLRRERIDFYHGEAKEQATTYPDFDIVLTDLLVPASGQAQGGEGMKFIGQEMPLGTTIALLALCAGVKKVAVVTDMNHHHHPASAAFDCLNGMKSKLEGIGIICTNRCGGVPIDETTGELVEKEFLKSDEGKKKYPYVGDSNWGPRNGLGYGKDWKTVLLKLTCELKEK